MPVISHPRSVSVGAVVIGQVSQVSWGRAGNATPVYNDADTYPSALVPGGVAVNSSVVANDICPALSLGMTIYGETTTTGVSVTFSVAQGSTAKVLIGNSMFLGEGGGAGHGVAGSVTYNFAHWGTGGSTNPVKWTGA